MAKLVIGLLVTLLIVAFSLQRQRDDDALYNGYNAPLAVQREEIAPQPAFQQEWEADPTMGGLLLSGLQDDGTCLYRSQHHLFGRRIEYKPSGYLISKLREYESRHQRCAARVLDLDWNSTSNSDCKFIVWISFEGLGNKMLSLASAFVYALVTNRVLLVDRGTDMAHLFCEPFGAQGPSWFVPSNGSFHKWMNGLNATSDIKLGNLIRMNKEALPGIVYMHLDWNSDSMDKKFFCEDAQVLLQENVDWLFIRANSYYLPALYRLPSFRHELDKLFPEPSTMFRYVSRYVLQPSNKVWEATTRYYRNKLAGADRLVGLQLRTFDAPQKKLLDYFDQLWSCLIRERLLPLNKSTNLLVTSLDGIYTEKLSQKLNKTRITVHSPSHEKVQMTDNAEHDEKALMEMFLLSMSDELVTSPRSTFGYVAQGLSGLHPWTLRGLEHTDMKERICARSNSSDPCFLFHPPLHACGSKGLATIKPCLDDPGKGIQIVDIFPKTS